MSPTPPAGLSEEDYETIEAAVMETARGRWFLAEYAKRNRNADTGAILTVLDRLERVVKHNRSGDVARDVKSDIVDMHRAIEDTRAELASLAREAASGGRLIDASTDLGTVVEATETATQDILAAAERIQEAAWHLREQGADDRLCDALDERATEIYLACSFQDLTGQRIARVVKTLKFIETRIGGLVDALGLDPAAGGDRQVGATTPALLNGPAPRGEGLAQTVVDDMLADEGAVDADDLLEPMPPPPGADIEHRAPTIVEPVELTFVEPEPPRRPPPPPMPAGPPRPVVVGATALAAAPVAVPRPAPVVEFAELSFAEKAALFS